MTTLTTDWADSRETDMAVATAIHAIADDTRSPDAIWEDPTQAEWDRVVATVEGYVRDGQFPFDASGYCWGVEVVRIKKADKC